MNLTVLEWSTSLIQLKVVDKHHHRPVCCGHTVMAVVLSFDCPGVVYVPHSDVRLITSSITLLVFNAGPKYNRRKKAVQAFVHCLISQFSDENIKYLVIFRVLLMLYSILYVCLMTSFVTLLLCIIVEKISADAFCVT